MRSAFPCFRLSTSLPISITRTLFPWPQSWPWCCSTCETNITWPHCADSPAFWCDKPISCGWPWRWARRSSIKSFYKHFLLSKATSVMADRIWCTRSRTLALCWFFIASVSTWFRSRSNCWSVICVVTLWCWSDSACLSCGMDRLWLAIKRRTLLVCTFRRWNKNIYFFKHREKNPNK